MEQSFIITVFLVSSLSCLRAQHIFPEKFEGCIIDQFAMERDTSIAKLNSIDFIQRLKDHLGESKANKLRGTLRLQIIVDLSGNSCLLSIENSTNIKTKKLDLKNWIDETLVWEIPSKKVGAIIVLEFTDLGIGYRRLGMDGKKGWHYLN